MAFNIYLQAKSHLWKFSSLDVPIPTLDTLFRAFLNVVTPIIDHIHCILSFQPHPKLLSFISQK